MERWLNSKSLLERRIEEISEYYRTHHIIIRSIDGRNLGGSFYAAKENGC